MTHDNALMPELPEVQTIVTALAERLTGRTIRAARLLRTDIITPRGVDFPRLIAGRQITGIGRRAKRIVFTLDNGQRFYIHLGMTGRLTIRDSGSGIRDSSDSNIPNPESRNPEPDRHTHLILSFQEDGRGGASPALHFTDPRRFGGIVWVGDESADGNLGPEPLTLRPGQLGRRLAKTSRPIKAALLDQQLIAGLGNIYADESLFAAGIHPLAVSNALDAVQVGRLNRAIKSTLRRAIRHGGSTLRDYRTATGETGAFQKIHQVYGREGQPCRRCGTAIVRIVVSGRSTCFCPKCQ